MCLCVGGKEVVSSQILFLVPMFNQSFVVCCFECSQRIGLGHAFLSTQRYVVHFVRSSLYLWEVVFFSNRDNAPLAQYSGGASSDHDGADDRSPVDGSGDSASDDSATDYSATDCPPLEYATDDSASDNTANGDRDDDDHSMMLSIIFVATPALHRYL